MNRLVTTLKLCYFNLRNTRDIKKKEHILNYLNDILLPLKPVLSMFTYLFYLDKCFSAYLEYHKLEHLQLLTYNLLALHNIINLSKFYKIKYENKRFEIVFNDDNIEEIIEEENEEEDLAEIELINDFSISQSLSWADN